MTPLCVGLMRAVTGSKGWGWWRGRGWGCCTDLIGVPASRERGKERGEGMGVTPAS